MENKIPTADSLINEVQGDEYNTAMRRFSYTKSQVENLMKKYAKLHVKAALKEALESIPCLGSSSDIASYEEVEEAVLLAYPESNIK